jgi:hypothetical protein
VRRYLAACEDLQDLLGSFNDMAVAMELAWALAEGGPLDRSPASGAFTRWCHARIDACRSQLDVAWKRFRQTTPIWR